MERAPIDLSVFVARMEVLCQYLESNPLLDLTRLRDDKNNSVLHITAYQNKLEQIKVLIDRIREIYDNPQHYDQGRFPSNKSPSKQIIKELVNHKNVEGYTALHYASLRGNVRMIKLLESLGASHLILTKSQLNLIHSAAQGDALPSILYLFPKFKLNLNDKDYSDSTALHWACYFGSQSVVEFLLAQPQVLINQRDSDGQTPLHVAVLNCRPGIVKRLLIKGANRNATNKREQTPLEISEHYQYSSISKMLDNRYTCADHCMFYCNKRRKYQPQFPSMFKPIMFIILFLYVAVGTHVLYVPRFPRFYVYVSASVHGLIILLYLSLLLKAPKQQKQEYPSLVQNIPICSECKSHRKLRMHHCLICNRCISQYDHHCPWINGCVGKHNIKRFIFFLIFLLTAMLLNSFFQVAGIFKLEIVFVEFNFFGLGEGLKGYFEIVYRVILILGFCVVAMFFFLAFGLLLNQLKNICQNTTTYERSSNNYKKKSIQTSSYQNSSESSISQAFLSRQRRRKAECSVRNCGLMCCASDV